MSQVLKQTLRILKKPKSGDDGSSRNVWSDPIETAEFELVSTMMLQKIMLSDDASAKKKIEDVAALGVAADGVLAHDAENDRYEIVDAENSEELSLVSTQMLQVVLSEGDTDDTPVHPAEIDSGFDPYNS